MNACGRLEKCYEVILEILENDIDMSISFEEMLKVCSKKIKGLREIEFWASLELESDIYSDHISRFLKKIKYI